MEEQREQEMISITVLIAGRPYPLRIKAEDEVSIRQIVKEVNEKVNNFQLTYTNKDKQDCLSMVLLTYAVDLFKLSEDEKPHLAENVIQDPQIVDKLSELDEVLDALL